MHLHTEKKSNMGSMVFAESGFSVMIIMVVKERRRSFLFFSQRCGPFTA